jgi:vacuolar protein sorting-associated protein 29
MLVPNKMQHVLCTGNIGREQYDELVALAPNVHVVQGDYNPPETNGNSSGLQFPDHTVCQVGQFRIGIVHGHQLLPWNSQDALVRMRQKLQVDILISGHSHQNSVQVVDGYYYLNPGSITGAYSALQEEITPSFILLAVTDNKLVCYVYELLDDQVEVSKTEFTKKEGTGGVNGASANANPALLQSLLT